MGVAAERRVRKRSNLPGVLPRAWKSRMRGKGPSRERVALVTLGQRERLEERLSGWMSSSSECRKLGLVIRGKETGNIWGPRRARRFQAPGTWSASLIGFCGQGFFFFFFKCKKDGANFKSWSRNLVLNCLWFRFYQIRRNNFECTSRWQYAINKEVANWIGTLTPSLTGVIPDKQKSHIYLFSKMHTSVSYKLDYLLLWLFSYVLCVQVTLESLKIFPLGVWQWLWYFGILASIISF